MPETNPQRRWEASYFDGQTARRWEAWVTVLASTLRIALSDGRQLSWPYESVRLTQGMRRGEHVRLEHGDAELLQAVVVTDAGFLAALHEVAPHAGFTPPRRSTWVWATGLGAALGIVVAAWGMYEWGLPGAADWMSRLVPVSWEEQLGGAVVTQLVPDDQRCEAPKTREAVEAVVARLAAVAGPAYHYQVTIVRSPQVNAFAAPGGRIVVFTGLLAKTHSADELAGVLAHEMQHVIKRHTTRALLRRAGMTLIVSALTGDTGQLGQIVGAAGTLGGLSYARADESEADREGLRMMEAAHLDPTGMIRVFEMLEAQEPGDEVSRGLAFLSDHPDTAARITALRAMVERETPERMAADDPAWAAAARGCE